jgi:large repetitive protein
VPVLLPGDSVSVTCTSGATYVLSQDDVDAGVRNNEATASGLDPDDEPVVGTDEESVPLTAAPGIVVAKSFTNADEDVSGSVTVDDTLTYTFVVENTGNVTLTGVELSDPLSGLSTIVCDDDVPAGCVRVGAG